MKNSALRSMFYAAFVAVTVIGSNPAFALGKANPQDELVLADFNSGIQPNNNGQDFGSWSKEFDDETQFTDMSFVPDDALNNPAGHSIRLDYDVDSPTQAYNGFWMTLKKGNFSPYSVVNFYIKGDKKTGFTKKMKIEFKDVSNRPSASYFMVTEITDEWQKVSVRFNQFHGTNDWSDLRQFVIVFNDMESRPKVGSIFIDQISISKT